MSRARLGAFVGAIGAIIALAISSVDCKQPTEIVVDVRAEGVLCDRTQGIARTGIAVSTYSKIEGEPLKIFEGPGCDPPGDRIGTLTITPSGPEDEEVAFRIVAGIGGKPAEQCAPPWDKCIVAIRKERFTPGRSKTVTVILAAACVGKYCGKDRECNLQGECVSSDGGKDDDVVRPDGAPPGDGPAGDAPFEVGGDACSPTNCLGTCNAGKCDVDCNSALIDCNNKVVCGPGLDCTIKCTTESVKCTNVRCNTPTGTCTIECENTTGSDNGKGCRDVACSASTCNVTCKGAGANSCAGVFVDGGKNTVTCLDTGQPDLQCDNVHCVTSGSGTCTRTCTPSAVCGQTSTCSPAGACTNWQDGG